MLYRVYYHSENEEARFSKEWLTMCGRVPSVQVYRKHKYVSVIGFYSYFMFQRYWTKTKQKVYQKKRVCWNGRCILRQYCYISKLWTTFSDFPGYSTTDIWYRGNEANCDTKKSESNYGSVPIEDTCQKNLPSKRIEKARFKKMFPEHDLYCCI